MKFSSLYFSVILSLFLPSLASSTYANSTCGPGSGAPLLSQGMDNIVVDGSDLQAWPSIVDSRRQNESLNKASWECNQGIQKKQTDQVELDVTADVRNSTPASPCETDSDPADAEDMQQKIQSQDGGQCEDNRMEKEMGPKQGEADIADDCKGLNEAVQLPSFSSNIKALISGACHSRTSGELLESGKIWGTSEESLVGLKSTGNNGVSREVSQTVWDEERAGLKNQAARGRLSDLPKGGMSGQVNESPKDCLQDTQIISTNTITTDSETGMSERGQEGSECESAGHGSGDGGTCSHNSSRAQSSCTEVTLQSMLSRSDLDPRVLCNIGWGQTQIKQSTAWDLEVDSSSESGRDWTEHAQIDINSPSCPQWSRDMQGQEKGGRNQVIREKGEQSEEKIDSKQGALLTGRGNSWVEEVEDEQVGRWDGNRRDGAQQREGGRGSWGLGDTQWGENKGRAAQSEKSWANSEDEGWRCKQHQGWGNNRHPQHNITNNQATQKVPHQQQLQQSQSQLTQPRGSQESRDLPSGPVALNQSSGWKPGPIPHMSSAIEPSGWEDPSPQSISRKMEIDDGTSAWGDPAHYDKRCVNMWDKSNLQQRGQPSQQQPEPMPETTLTSRDKNTGWH